MEGSTTQEEFDSSFMLPQSKSKNKHIHPITHHPVLDLRLINSGKGVIIDSGTTDTYLGTTLKTPFETKWKEIMSSKGWADYHNEEVELTENDILSLPSILIQLQVCTVISRPINRRTWYSPVSFHAQIHNRVLCVNRHLTQRPQLSEILIPYLV